MRGFVTTLAMTLCAVIALNAYADVAGTHDGSVRRLARAQAPGLVLASQKEFDQRAWVEGRLERCPEVLVTGSSTAGALEETMFGGRSVLNAWLTGPTVEDFEALTVLLERHGCKPALILFGLDAFLFNGQNREQRWQAWRDLQLEFSHPTTPAERMLGNVRSAWSAFEDSLAFETTRASLELVWKGGGRAGEGPRLVRDVAPPHSAGSMPISDVAGYCRTAASAVSLRYADGHFSACPQFELPPSVIDERARSYLARNFHRMASFDTLDHARLTRLGAIVARMSRLANSVILFAPPYHPATFAAISEDARLRRLLAELDRSLLAIAQAARASYVVFRDPASVECSAGSFSDSHHSRADCSAKIAHRLLAASAAGPRASRR